LENPKKLALSFTPTPLHPLHRLSEKLGVETWIKRDDLTGCIATGGNKIRKLEYILADALGKRADSVITTGGPQSNHAKATAALAVKVGLQPILVLAGAEPGERRANLFLDQLVGADIHFTGAVTPDQMERALEEKRAELSLLGKTPYVIPIGGSNGYGTLGYADAYLELGEHDFDWIFVTAGSGGTYAGLALGMRLDMLAERKKIHPKLLGISPWLRKSEIEQRIEECMKEAQEITNKEDRLKKQSNSSQQQLFDDYSSNFIIDDRYIGKGYGRITAEAKEAIQLMAENEGILLDHVYTGKAMSGLIDYIQKGIIRKDEKVLFWHTGGAPGLLAIQDEW
jgi:D-cysteine desulfhydrase family pyridoxal phosphate-dependent enzyme